MTTAAACSLDAAGATLGLAHQRKSRRELETALQTAERSLGDAADSLGAARRIARERGLL